MSMHDHLAGRQPPSRSHSRSATHKIVVLAFALVTLIAAGIVLYMKGQAAQVRTDAGTLCPTDRAPAQILVVLLDMSDEFSEPQRLKIQNELDRLVQGIPRFGLIEAYAVDSPTRGVTTPLVHLCNPGTGADLSKIYQNPELAKHKWAHFARHLLEALQKLMARPASSTSAIFEAVQATALRTFNRPEYENVPKQLVLVSDLLQNVPGKLSQYETLETFSEFKSSPYYSQIRADLSGVSVTFVYLVRPQTPQRWPDHYRFWEEYFVDQGASVDRVEPVYGAQ